MSNVGSSILLEFLFSSGDYVYCQFLVGCTPQLKETYLQTNPVSIIIKSGYMYDI